MRSTYLILDSSVLKRLFQNNDSLVNPLQILLPFLFILMDEKYFYRLVPIFPLKPPLCWGKEGRALISGLKRLFKCNDPLVSPFSVKKIEKRLKTPFCPSFLPQYLLMYQSISIPPPCAGKREEFIPGISIHTPVHVKDHKFEHLLQRYLENDTIFCFLCWWKKYGFHLHIKLAAPAETLVSSPWGYHKLFWKEDTLDSRGPSELHQGR